jgi:hypothetical protein
MAKPFERFESELSWQQVSLLLDTVLYFEESPKLLSLPEVNGATIAVPLLPDTLRTVLAALSEDEPSAKKRFLFDWSGTEAEGDVLVTLPGGETIKQPTVVAAFSPV